MPSLEAQPRTRLNRMSRTRQCVARSAMGFKQKAQCLPSITTWKICGWFSREVSFSSYAENVLSKSKTSCSVWFSFVFSGAPAQTAPTAGAKRSIRSHPAPPTPLPQAQTSPRPPFFSPPPQSVLPVAAPPASLHPLTCLEKLPPLRYPPFSPLSVSASPRALPSCS